MKKVLLSLILLCVLGMTGCGYIFPSSVNVEPAETSISEEREVKKPAASQNSKRITVRINRAKEEVK